MLMFSEILSRITLPLGETLSVEELTRSALDLLQLHTGFESTYLTRLDRETGMVRVDFSRNTKALQIPEGTSVRWGETLCKRALEEPGFDRRVAAIIEAVPAAKALGIRAYASSPIFLESGEFYGTLCAASCDQIPISEQGRMALGLYAKVIGQQVERERQATAQIN